MVIKITGPTVLFVLIMAVPGISGDTVGPAPTSSLWHKKQPEPGA